MGAVLGRYALGLSSDDKRAFVAFLDALSGQVHEAS
jgi:hypothetical protein